MYFNIPRVAQIAGSSTDAVIAAARIGGVRIIGNYLWFSEGTMPLWFGEELVLARDAERAAAQRRQRAAQAQTGSPYPTLPPEVARPVAAPRQFHGHFAKDIHP